MDNFTDYVDAVMADYRAYRDQWREWWKDFNKAIDKYEPPECNCHLCRDLKNSIAARMAKRVTKIH